MIALGRVHIHKMDSDFPLAAVTHDGAHPQFSAKFGFLDSEVNFDFCSDRELFFAQNADSNGAQVREDSLCELARGSEQHAPISGAPGARSPFGSIVVGQSVGETCQPAKARDTRATLAANC